MTDQKMVGRERCLRNVQNQAHNPTNVPNKVSNLPTRGSVCPKWGVNITEISTQNIYLLDPHGSTGYLAAKKYLKSHLDDHVIFLETALPSKFLETVEDTTGIKVEIPERLKRFQNREKVSMAMSKEFEDFKDYLKSIG